MIREDAFRQSRAGEFFIVLDLGPRGSIHD
jgi:hypothetical protein